MSIKVEKHHQSKLYISKESNWDSYYCQHHLPITILPSGRQFEQRHD